MNRLLRLIALGAACLFVTPLVAQDNKDAKDPKPAAAAPAADGKRTPEQIEADLQKASGELREVIGSPDVMLDPAKRQAAAPKAIPAIKRMSALLDEVVKVQPEAKAEIAGAQLEFLSLLNVLGDADARASLDQLAKGGGPQALDAQAAQQLTAYWNDPKDEAAQSKALDAVEKLAKANPKSDALTQVLMKMATMGASSKAVAERAEGIIISTLTGEGAQQVAVRLKGEKKLRDSVGKPIELTGTQVDGSPFSTKAWKGKVILVDFWATWCAPCLAELPRVKKAYLNHHAKGLEILGVSCDSDAAELTGFLEKNKDMPWPQLFDAKENPKLQWNPIAKEWGINGIPSMFLIDKKGILRSVEARKNFEEEIPKLLAETAE